MSVRRRVHKLPAQPLTDSAVKLKIWLEMPPRRRQAELANACSVSQQTISEYKRRAARPDPGSEIAFLIEIATGGFVLAAGWLTTDEVRLRRENQKRAANFAELEARQRTPRTSRRRQTPRPRSGATLDETDEREGARGGWGT
jgi:hypothetical protein